MIGGSTDITATKVKTTPASMGQERRAQAARLMPVSKADSSTVKARRHSNSGSKDSIIKRRWLLMMVNQLAVRMDQSKKP